MKPTVSETITDNPDRNTDSRTVGSRVANNISLHRTSSFVSLLKRVDLPAFVYPTSEIIGVDVLDLLVRCNSRVLTTF